MTRLISVDGSCICWLLKMFGQNRTRKLGIPTTLPIRHNELNDVRLDDSSFESNWVFLILGRCFAQNVQRFQSTSDNDFIEIDRRAKWLIDNHLEVIDMSVKRSIWSLDWTQPESTRDIDLCMRSV